MQFLDSMNLSGNRIVNVGDPVDDSDVVTKRHLDAVKQGLNQKDEVVAATTANITLSGLQTIDTVVLNEGDRVLVKDQTDQTQNGIYVASSGVWLRSDDANEDVDMKPGTYVFVGNGSQNIYGGFMMMNVDPVTLGTTAIRFTRFSAAGQINAGNGLTKTGQTIDVQGTPSRIVANSDSIDIASDYIGQTSINTLGTVTTGVWNAGVIPVAYGGTGAADAAGAKTNLQFLTEIDLKDLQDATADYSTAASNMDATTYVYKTVQYKRFSSNTLYMQTTLSNPNISGDYQTLTIDYYAEDGITKTATHTWTLTYDAQHSVVTKTRTT